MLILPQFIANPRNDLFALILHTNEVFPRFFCDISATKLIGADPCDGCFAALKLHFLGVKGNTVAHTDFVPIVAINDEIIPYHKRLTATVSQKIRF